MKKAFTLIELLVVIAIIAILASLLMPSLSKAKENSKKILCASNQKQIGQGVQMYANDNNGWIPYYDMAGFDNYWYNMIQPYAGGKVANRFTSEPFWPAKPNGIWACPSTSHNCWIGYGWNYHGLGYTPTDPRLGPTRLGTGRGHKIMTADNQHAYDLTEVEAFLSAPSGGSNNIRTHNNGPNVLFVDGHVRWYKLEDFRSYSDGKWW